MPLVNEVVIGLKDKNRFNASEPKDDGQFADYVTNPTLPTLLEVLFGGAGVKAPTNFPRTDLVAAFLTGVEGVNKPANVVVSEMVRLNTSIAPTPGAAQNRLGVLGGDNAGFPNGRRPGDDVVDIELRVAMGVLCTVRASNRGRLQAVRRARGRAALHRRRVPELGVLRQRVPVPARAVEGLAQRRQRDQGETAGREVGGGRTGPGADAPGPSHSEMPK